ncbi:hypothetical protein EMIHUDRAFT_455934, partial [Emiliania huxleyi CCMP1516]|uniref:Uncharacterized protein n=2 Tax=Emiliania huxleyi TaxID=2903 RepID=A0A0D3KAU3_EMIH1
MMRALLARRCCASSSSRQSGFLRLVGRRRQSSAGPAEPAPEAESSAWPLAAGGALAASILLAGVAAKRERLVARVQACVEESGPQGLASDGASLLQIGGLMLAFSLAQLPVDELKLRLLASGAVQQWGQLVASFEADVQQVALGALTALLEGAEPMAAFNADAGLYSAYRDALPPVLHASPTATPLNDSEAQDTSPNRVHRWRVCDMALACPQVLLDALRLAAALANHPQFEHASTDGWFFERLLEQAAPATEMDSLAALYWSCAAAAASRRSDVAMELLTSPTVKRYLVLLAPPPDTLLGAASQQASDEDLGELLEPYDGIVPEAAEQGYGRLQGDAAADLRDWLIEEYSRLALCRLAAHAAEAEEERAAAVAKGWEAAMTEEERAAWYEPFFETHATPPSDEPPPLPPPLASQLTTDEHLAEALASVAACALGGVVWGALRGLARRRGVLRAVGTTAAGAGLFEAAMQLKLSLRGRLEGDGADADGGGNFG